MGYALGAPDTADFAARFREEWLPRAAERFPAPAEHGVPADRLCAVRASTAARAFYDRLEFRELDVPDPGSSGISAARRTGTRRP
ncbi:hypothetical protein ACVW0K_000062 [Streptomyces filamentosus]